MTQSFRDSALDILKKLQLEHPQISLCKMEELPISASLNDVIKCWSEIEDNALDYLRGTVNSAFRKLPL